MQDCFYFNFRKGWHAWVFRFLNASQEPLWARNMRPLRLPDPCPLAHTPVVVCKVSGPPVLFYASHWLWGTRCSPHIHPAVTVGGSYWHSVCDGFHVLLVLCQNFRIVVIMRLRILATIASDPLFEIIRTIVAINSCTSPRSHFGTSSVPPPTTMGADPSSAFFFWRQIDIHTQQEGHDFARPPLGSPQA